MRAKASCLLLWLWMRCNSRFPFLRIGCCQSFFFVGDACFWYLFTAVLPILLPKQSFPPTMSVAVVVGLSAILVSNQLKGSRGQRGRVLTPYCNPKKSLTAASLTCLRPCLSKGLLLLGALPHVFVIPMQSFQF